MFRKEFPQIESEGVYLDSAATALKPRILIEATRDYYSKEVSNIHRGVHGLGANATHSFEKSRDDIARFIGAKSSELIFSSGTTDSINMASQMVDIEPGENIVLSVAEHHSNILPWQAKGVDLRYVKLNSEGTIDLQDLGKKVDANTRVVSLFHLSNVMGTVNPLDEIASIVRKNSDAILIYDAAQSFAHMRINMKEIDCDMVAFSAHKAYGPNGLGALFVREGLGLRPSRVGGGMVTDVTLESATYVEPPHLYEAGTPNMVGVVSFAKILPFLEEVIACSQNEDKLLDYLRTELSKRTGINFVTPKSKSLVSFNVDGVHSDDFGQLLSEQNIFVRTGSHCCIPLMRELGVSGTIRVSVGIYNNKEDIDRFVAAFDKAKKILGV